MVFVSIVKSWKAESEKARAAVKIGRFESKTCSIYSSEHQVYSHGIVRLSFLDKGKTINNQTYLKNA